MESGYVQNHNFQPEYQSGAVISEDGISQLSRGFTLMAEIPFFPLWVWMILLSFHSTSFLYGFFLCSSCLCRPATQQKDVYRIYKLQIALCLLLFQSALSLLMLF
ncbi:hypothetical protein Dimus_012186 [Dionaea muscipula]